MGVIVGVKKRAIRVNLIVMLLASGVKEVEGDSSWHFGPDASDPSRPKNSISIGYEKY